MTPIFTASYRHTGPLLRRFYFGELWRTQGGWLLSVPLALGVAIWSSLNPDYWWFSGFLAGAALSYMGLLYSSYRRAQRYRLDHVVNTTITDDGLHFDFASATRMFPGARSHQSVRLLTGSFCLLAPVPGRFCFHMTPCHRKHRLLLCAK